MVFGLQDDTPLGVKACQPSQRSVPVTRTVARIPKGYSTHTGASTRG